MSIEQTNSPIDVAKRKAKHLHSILKVRIPDISLCECLNSYARLEGARDWNTLSATLKTQSPEESAYKNIGAFIDGILRPMMVQIATAHEMEFSAPKAYFVAQIDGDESVVSSKPSKELEVTFRPMEQKNTDFSFSIQVSATTISQERAEMTFKFPKNAFAAAASILSSQRMPYDLTPSLLRTSEKGETMYCLILSAEPFFHSAGLANEIWHATEKIEYVRQEVDETLAKYAKLNVACQKLCKQWNNKRLLASFETVLWEAFTGKPRFMSAPTEFHRTVSGEVTLTAHVGKFGPYVSGAGGTLNLGVSFIIYRKADEKESAGYYIAKYGNDHEADIYLKGVSKEDILNITAEFGVPPDYELASQLGIPFEDVKEGYVAFYRSKAFTGLQEWVSKNRSYARKIGRHAAYLPDWYERATGQRPVPNSDEDLVKEGEAARNRRSRR